MFFELSKVAWAVLAPSNLLLILLALGLALAARERLRRLGLSLAVAAGALIAILGLSPIPNLVLNPLETRFPPHVDDGRPIAGVIVLGGALSPDPTVDLGQPILNEAGERIMVGYMLARRHPQARIVLPGGSGRMLGRDRFTEADATARIYVEMGIDPARLVLEDGSRNTHENAAFTRALVEPQPGETWLLVTSAWHMPRSVGVFRQAGFPVTAYPVDFRTVGGDTLGSGFRSASEGLMRLDIGVREWLGLLAYWATGRIAEPFPGPG